MNENMRNFDFFEKSSGKIMLFLMVSPQRVWTQWAVKGAVDDDVGDPAAGLSVEIEGISAGTHAGRNGWFNA